MSVYPVRRIWFIEEHRDAAGCTLMCIADHAAAGDRNITAIGAGTRVMARPGILWIVGLKSVAQYGAL